MENLNSILNILRQRRNFNVDNYIEAKTEAINNFFKRNNLDSCVVGISGGVDSAVVYSLLYHASKKEGSPIKKILGLIMPISGKGTTNQISAMNKARRFCAQISESNDFSEVTESKICDLTKAYEAYLQNSAYAEKPWSAGQLASIVRTPCLYFHTALLQENGYKSIVVGTTNRDEGSYIGFFGKASDGMVDLQIIADLHKSEVYQVAEKLGVTKEIISAAPAGDVHDGKTDEEMIGAPYWFLEMYLLLKTYYTNKEIISFSVSNKFLCKNGYTNKELQTPEFFSPVSLKRDEKVSFFNWMKSIEELNMKNSHKYKVGSPSHFIDVMDRKISENGWQ